MYIITCTNKIYWLSLLHKIFKVNIIDILYSMYMYIFSEGKKSLHLCSENSRSISYCYMVKHMHCETSYPTMVFCVSSVFPFIHRSSSLSRRSFRSNWASIMASRSSCASCPSSRPSAWITTSSPHFPDLWMAFFLLWSACWWTHKLNS